MAVADEYVLIKRASLDSMADTLHELSDTSEGLTVPDGYNALAREIANSGGSGETPTDSWHDTFWDTFQDYGNQTDWDNAFGTAYGTRWHISIFKPKYEFKIKVAVGMFQNCKLGNFADKLVDLPALFQSLGLGEGFDWSVAYRCSNMFQNATVFSRIGVVDSTNMSSYAVGFSGCSNLVTLDKYISKDGMPFPDFTGCGSLTNLTVTGVISESVTITSTTSLSVGSVESILLALKDFSDSDEAFTRTVKFHDKIWDAAGALYVGGMSCKSYLTSIGWNY